MSHEVPFVAKESVTVISVGDSFEAITIRTLLESFNYRVTVHWVGSRKELLEILQGNIATDETVVLSCHGIEEGIVIPDEPTLTAHEISEIAVLKGKTVISLGCLTGSTDFISAYKVAGVSHYIAPVDYPEGKAAVVFISNLFFLLASNVPIDQAVSRASIYDTETHQFQLLF